MAIWMAIPDAIMRAGAKFRNLSSSRYPRGLYLEDYYYLLASLSKSYRFNTNLIAVLSLHDLGRPFLEVVG